MKTAREYLRSPVSSEPQSPEGQDKTPNRWTSFWGGFLHPSMKYDEWRKYRNNPQYLRRFRKEPSWLSRINRGKMPFNIPPQIKHIFEKRRTRKF